MLNCIRNSALARAKLEAFKKYLIFTSFARLGVVVLSLVQNNSPLPISPLMILLLGLIGDFFALFVISAMKTSFVLKQDFNRTVSQRVSLISDSCYALGGFFASFCISVLIVILLSYNLIQNSNTQVFCMYSLASVQLFALGAILLSMKSAVKGLNINYLYVSLMLLWIITLICQFWLPDDIYVSLTELKIYRLNLTASPFVIVLGLLSFAFVRCIERLKNSFFKHRAN